MSYLPDDCEPAHTYGNLARMPVNLWTFGSACKPTYGPWIKPKDPGSAPDCCPDCRPDTWV